MTYLQMHHRAVICAKKNENVTYCDDVIDAEAKVVTLGSYEVCAVCRCAAKAEGVTLPRSVSYEA